MKWASTVKREVCHKFSSLFIYFSLSSHWKRTTEDIVPTERGFIHVLCSSVQTAQSCFLEKSVIFLSTSSVSHASDTESVDKHISVFCSWQVGGIKEKKQRKKDGSGVTETRAHTHRAETTVHHHRHTLHPGCRGRLRGAVFNCLMLKWRVSQGHSLFIYFLLTEVEVNPQSAESKTQSSSWEKNCRRNRMTKYVIAKRKQDNRSHERNNTKEF